MRQLKLIDIWIINCPVKWLRCLSNEILDQLLQLLTNGAFDAEGRWGTEICCASLLLMTWIDLFICNLSARL